MLFKVVELIRWVLVIWSSLFKTTLRLYEYKIETANEEKIVDSHDGGLPITTIWHWLAATNWKTYSHTGNAHINKNVCFRMTRNNWNPKYCLLPK